MRRRLYSWDVNILPSLPLRTCAAVLSLAVFALPSSAESNSKRDARWREEIRKALFVPDKLPALNTKVWSTFDVAEGVKADRVTYATADGMIVPAVVYYPIERKGKLPGIVVVNGHGSDKFGWYAFWSGIMFARAGAVVVTYDPIGEGERNIDKKSNAGSHDKKILIDDSDQITGQRLAGLMQVDAMQAISYLRSRKDVDKAKIGMVGYSMGSFIGGITGAIDTRLHALVLSGGGDYDGVNGYFDNNALPCQRPPYKALLKINEDRGAMLYTLNADRGPTYIMNGLQDTVVDIPHHAEGWFADLHKRVVTLHGSDRNVFETVFYPWTSHRTSWVNRDGFLWLEDNLGFANWSRAQISSVPTTHISTWAVKNNVAISKNYIREDREGGLDAVGDNVPGVPRADLMVLPDADWEKLKPQLIYESWAEKITKEVEKK